MSQNLSPAAVVTSALRVKTAFSEKGGPQAKPGCMMAVCSVVHKIQSIQANFDSKLEVYVQQ